MIVLPAPDAIAFFVSGKPAPGGSKTAIPFVKKQPGVGGKQKLGVRVFDNAKFGKEWRSIVAATARGAMGTREPMRGPLCVSFTFWMPRPPSHFTSKKLVKPSAPVVPEVRPDVLKLARSTEDSLTSIVYEDDAQIADESLSRRYGDPVGALVVVWRYGSPKPTYDDIQLRVPHHARVLMAAPKMRAAVQAELLDLTGMTDSQSIRRPPG